MSFFIPFVALLADAADPAAGPAPPEFVRTLLNTLPLALIAAAAYLLLFRPEQERRKRQQDLLGGLKKNDRVVTTAGIYGTVANVERDADRVVLKIDDAANVKITVTLSSIARVLGDEKSEARTARDES
jgi:preprotein translocase subunit YajC